jgi:hypothetical protein
MDKTDYRASAGDRLRGQIRSGHFRQLFRLGGTDGILPLNTAILPPSQLPFRIGRLRYHNKPSRRGFRADRRIADRRRHPPEASLQTGPGGDALLDGGYRDSLPDAQTLQSVELLAWRRYFPDLLIARSAASQTSLPVVWVARVHRLKRPGISMKGFCDHNPIEFADSSLSI